MEHLRLAESNVLGVTGRPEHAVPFTSAVHDLKSIVASSDRFLTPGCDISAFCGDRSQEAWGVKNEICSICLRWWTSLTWASSGVQGTWLKQTLWIGHSRTSSLSPRRCTGAHSLHTSLLGKTIPLYAFCASFLWLQIDKVSAQRAKDYTIEACEGKQLFSRMLVQTTTFRMATQSMFPP